MSDVELVPLWEDFSYKAHQISGINWLLQREAATPSGGLLCDEMGLGKTIEILGLMANSPSASSQQTLLLCPKAVIKQWATAARRSRMNVCEVVSEEWSMPRPFFSGRPFLFITNYEKAPNRPSLFRGRTWSRIVLDEAHRVKNHNGELYKAVEKMQRRSTWCVTATPVVNRLMDIRNLYALVGFDKGHLANYSNLLAVMSEACLHRSMAEMRPVLPELPSAAVISKKQLDFVSEEEAEFYRGVQGMLMRRWRALPRDAVIAKLALLMRLRQLSVHPQVYINARRKGTVEYEREDWSIPSTKFSALREMIANESSPTKWIIFCQFHDEMELLEGFLERNPAVWRVQSYHGGMKQSEKEQVIEKTHEEQPGQTDGSAARHDVLLLQLQSGGVGLNLQHFTRVVFMSPWWTSALMDQAIGRAVRIGQEEEVEVTMLLLQEEASVNIDEAMMEKAELKRDLLTNLFKHASRGVVEEDDFEPEDVGEEEFDVEDVVDEEAYEYYMASQGVDEDPR